MRIANGYVLAEITVEDVRKMTDGSILIVMRVLRNQQGKFVRREYYRAELQRKKTAAGYEEVLSSAPNDEWETTPVWDNGWIWLGSEKNRVDGYFIIDGKA